MPIKNIAEYIKPKAESYLKKQAEKTVKWFTLLNYFDRTGLQNIWKTTTCNWTSRVFLKPS
jgi:hypothetical protein